MDMEEYLDHEIYDFKAILPEIYSLQPLFSHDNTTGQQTETSDQASKRGHTSSDQPLKSSSSWKSSANYHEIMISPKAPPRPSSTTAAPASTTPQLISFENSGNFSLLQTNSDSGPYNSNPGHEMARDHSSSPQIISFSSLVEDDSPNEQYHDASIGILSSHNKSFTANRTPLQAQDHLIAERKRRRKLGQLFITLSKTVPGLKKLDKASLLEDAIDYLKTLQERVSALEEEEVKRVSSMDASKVDTINIRSTSSESAAPEIKARVSNRNVLIKICCKKRKGLMSRIPCEMEKMHLSVTDMRVMPFGDAALDITILAEMHSEFQGTVKDIVDQLEIIFLNPHDEVQNDLH